MTTAAPSAFITEEWAKKEMLAGLDQGVEFVQGSYLFGPSDKSKECSACFVGYLAFHALGDKVEYIRNITNFVAEKIGVTTDVINALSDGYEDARAYKDRDDCVKYIQEYYRDDEVTRCYKAAFDATADLLDELKWSEDSREEYDDED